MASAATEPSRLSWVHTERGRFLAKGLLLVVVLGLHCYTRVHTAATRPLATTYPQVYAVSFALMGGQGFQAIGFPNVDEATPLKEFLALQRNRVSRKELEDCFTNTHARPSTALAVNHKFHTSRILDIYSAALLWKIFGISWRVYFIAYALVSTLACLLVFCIARKLGDSYWPGLFAAVLFLASPLENHYASLSIRDISPLWFAILSFYVLVCVADKFRSRALNFASFVALGAAAHMGIGWRTDVLFLTPFLLAGLVVYLWQKERGWRYIIGAALLFGLGTAGIHGLLNVLCPESRGNPQVVFHIAYYGEYPRCNLLGLEHSLQIPRDDGQTEVVAGVYHASQNPQAAPVEFLDQQYSPICQQMYFEALQYNAYHWISQLPRLYCLAIRASEGHAMLMPFLPGVGYNVEFSGSFPRGGLATASAPLLDCLAGMAPYLFLISIVPVLWCCRQRLLPGVLILFSLFYTVILIAVLPEYKHAGMMLLPVTVIGGLGIWTLVRLAQPPWTWSKLPGLSWNRFRLVTIALLVVGLSWAGACALAHTCSLAKRASYLQDINALAENGTPIPEAIKSARIFATMTPDNPGAKVGYLLKIKTGAQPGQLLCKQPLHLKYHTHHQLHPDRVQYFFVTSFLPPDYSKNADKCPTFTGLYQYLTQSHACIVTLDGDAEILSAVRVDMSGWTKLCVSTVFHEDEQSPGSPWVDAALSGDLWYCPPETALP